MYTLLKSDKSIISVYFQFDFYDLHKTQLIDALETHNCIVIDVNGNRSAAKVHADILTKLLKV